jgi:Glyoxalase-like domain
MRRSAVLLCFPLLCAAQIRIDHVSIAGRAITELRAHLATIGIASEPGGRHTNRATEMEMVSFPDGSYLELIGIQANPDPAALAAHPWSALMRSEAGPAAWAARVKDFEAEVTRLRSVGVTVQLDPRGGRERSDGVRLEWQTAHILLQDSGRVFPFLIQDVTPRARRAFPSGHPSTKDFEGIRYIVIAVRDLKQGIDRYHTAFGVPPPIKQVHHEFGAQLALLGAMPVILAAPISADSPLQKRLDAVGEGPVAVVLTGRNAERFKVVHRARWFGKDVSWFDEAVLGWRLGFE